MKILLFGASGQIGQQLQRALCPLGDIIAPARHSVDLADAEALRACIRTQQPALIVNAAGFTAVDAAETDLATAFGINADAPQVLAQEAARLGAWMVHYSTDYVFDGTKATPYDEQDRPHPLSVYGRSKLAGEEGVRAACPRHLILRSGWVYSAQGKNFPTTILRLALERARLRVVDDQTGTPTHAALVADLTATALGKLLNQEHGEHFAGTYHVSAGGATNWHFYARYLLELARELRMPLQASAETVDAISSAEYAAPARRPHNSRLDTTRFRQTFNVQIPDWRLHVEALIAELARQESP